MPPKAAPEGDSKQIIVALCNMMLTCPEFKIDSNALAPIFNVSHAKNVGRKINSIIGPYGFEYKSNKIIHKDGAAAPATPTRASDDATTTAAPAATATATAKTAPLKTNVSRKKPAATPANTPATKTKVNKKRKLEAVSADNTDDEKSAVKTEEVTKAKPKDVIKTEDHPMTHVADDFEEEKNTTTGAEEGDVEIKAEITAGSNED